MVVDRCSSGELFVLAGKLRCSKEMDVLSTEVPVS
jgi:hypothetical protein